MKGKSSLLCLATSMFPPEVQFSWRTKDNKRTIPEREQVELREEEHAAAILRINHFSQPGCKMFFHILLFFHVF
uniref:Ig-like domain-containing protein n=1 Tax=Myripristis murdjan TaxID=586833 RepID=A0A667WWT7_9TELE